MAYGQVAADQITTSVSGYSLGAGNSSLLKNKIINGHMVIDQRNAGASVTPNNSYTLDRWLGINSQTGKFTVQQNAGSVTPPAGFTNYLGITSTSAYSIGATDYFGIVQYIEGFNVADLGWGTANAKTVTLSFQVYSSLTGTFGGTLNNSANTQNYPFTYSIPVANTWTAISITIAGSTTGAWVTNNGVGLMLRLGLGVGSTYSGTAGSWQNTQYLSATGATSVVGTNGATFYITGVQLEVGSSATGYEYRQYGQELALCQRYYYQIKPNVLSSGICSGVMFTATAPLCTIIFPVSMRSAPTLTNSSISDFVGVVGNSTPSLSSVSLSGSSNNNTRIDFVSSSVTAGQGVIIQTQSTNATLQFNSEL